MKSSQFRMYDVFHRTTYKYAATVTLSHQQLHLTPRNVPFQKLVSHDITIKPEVSHRTQSIDNFGNPLTSVSIESPHTELDIVARTQLGVGERDWPQPDATPAWETVRDTMLYQADRRPNQECLEASQYLYESPHVRVKRDLANYVEDCFTKNRPVLSGADALMAKIHREFEFDVQATTVNTPVMKVFQERRGVCQDFTHFMISCLRSIGLAARYMSGYLVTHASVEDSDLVGADASHAWVALFVPGSGWIDLDPTNNLRPGLQHVILGWGRDFSDVTPLRGVINAGGEQNLKVSVRVQAIDSVIHRS